MPTPNHRWLWVTALAACAAGCDDNAADFEVDDGTNVLEFLVAPPAAGSTAIPIRVRARPHGDLNNIDASRDNIDASRDASIARCVRVYASPGTIFDPFRTCEGVRVAVDAGSPVDAGVSVDAASADAAASDDADRPADGGFDAGVSPPRPTADACFQLDDRLSGEALLMYESEERVVALAAALFADVECRGFPIATTARTLELPSRVEDAGVDAPLDAGPGDGGPSDAGQSDAALTDAASTDAPPADAGPADAHVTLDASPADAGFSTDGASE